jgi:predicted nucleic acid-binding protein
VLNPPSTLIDHSFLTAVADADDAHHHEAIAIYPILVDNFVAQRCLLVARADQLAEVDKPELFAPIDKLHVARQHRNAAADLAARTGIEADVALTLVMIQRHRIRRVASFDERLNHYDLEIIRAAPSSTSNFVAAESLDDSTATTLQPGAN